MRIAGFAHVAKGKIFGRFSQNEILKIRKEEREMKEMDNPPFSSKDLAEIAKAASEPVRLLIEKTASAIGRAYHPLGIVLDAKAEGIAAKMKARSDIEVRTIERLFQEEVQKQENMEKIRDKAIPLLSENANPSAIDEDWINNFFQYSRNVSSEYMQSLWARLLAQEANQAGTHSKRILRFLSELEKKEAQDFSFLSSYVIVHERYVPNVAYQPEAPESPGNYKFNITAKRIIVSEYIDYGQCWDVDFQRLEEIGLISTSKTSFPLLLSKEDILKYGQSQFKRNEKKLENGYVEYASEVWTGGMKLTTLGEELLRIPTLQENPKFILALMEAWNLHPFVEEES